MNIRRFFILILSLVSLPLIAQDIDPLMSAYQKEFVFLDNEIRLLQQRLDEVARDGDRRVQAAENELSDLEAKLLALGVEVEAQAGQLRVLEEERNNTEDAADTVETIINQANSRLAKGGIPTYLQSLPDKGESLEDSEKLQGELIYVFEESFGLLHQYSRIRTEKGEFFLPDGKIVEGQIVHIGEVASLGSAGNRGGTLAPAGGGLLRLALDEYQETAEKLIAGEQPRELPLFIYESLDNLVETDSGKKLMDTIRGGGFIGLIIIAMGLLSIILIVIRMILIRKTGKGISQDVEALAARVKKREWEEALTFSRGMPSAIGRVLTSTIQGLKADPDKVEDTIAESVMNEQPPLEKFRVVITVFATVAPLLGLLGTVTGMIATFDIITVYGTGDPKLLSGGISEALITTQFGMMVAIPTLLLGNLLSSWADSINSTLEVKALRIVNAFTGNKE